jgi:hypothetical protein
VRVRFALGERVGAAVAVRHRGPYGFRPPFTLGPI